MSSDRLSRLARYLPFVELANYQAAWLRHDMVAAVIVALLAVPQGVAYALIAGLPPVMGLYAAALPTIFGGLFRSSRHVVTGPTNAVSLLVGSAVAAGVGGSPVQIALTLALVVGTTQLLAGVLRLGSLVDYISGPVVLGYITGAAMLVALGQLSNVTGTTMYRGRLPARLAGWFGDLGDTHMASLGIAAVSLVVLIIVRRIDRRIPGALLVMVGSIAASVVFELRLAGVVVVADLAGVPAGLPPLTLPSLTYVTALAPAAFACMVLSLVESTAVTRALAVQSGQRLNISTEFAGQGIANIAGAFFGAYPTSASLARSALNYGLGAKTRLASILSGVVMLLVLVLFAHLVDQTPIASLAAVLFVVVYDLVDLDRIRSTIKSSFSDATAFVATVGGTLMLPLDQAIYVGVGISLVLFLRRARMLIVRDMIVDDGGHLREIEINGKPDERACPAIRILHIEGPLFFGAAGELSSTLEDAVADPALRVLILRLKRTQAMDITSANVIESMGETLKSQGRHLILAGQRRRVSKLLKRTGIADKLGEENLFPSEPGWFVAMENAMKRAVELAGDHACRDSCPVATHVAKR